MKKLVLQNLYISEPSLSGPSDEYRSLQSTDSEHETGYYIAQENTARNSYHHFPVLLLEDGSVWHHGTLYLLSKIEGYLNPLHYKTLENIASDLRIYIHHLESLGISYLDSVKRKMDRPTYVSVSYTHLTLPTTPYV